MLYPAQCEEKSKIFYDILSLYLDPLNSVIFQYNINHYTMILNKFKELIDLESDFYECIPENWKPLLFDIAIKGLQILESHPFKYNV